MLANSARTLIAATRRASATATAAQWRPSRAIGASTSPWCVLRLMQKITGYPAGSCPCLPMLLARTQPHDALLLLLQRRSGAQTARLGQACRRGTSCP